MGNQVNNVNVKKPSDGFKGLIENWRSDAISGFLVFLIALPLSLGIAKGSFGDDRAVMGLFTAIIGGVVVAFFSGTQLAIKGPAAGLMTLVAGAVALPENGGLGYEGALAAMFVAAVVQIVFGLLKVGRTVNFFPITAVHGMLASIGLMIMIKQVKDLVGSTNVKPEAEILHVAKQIPAFIADLDLKVLMIGLVSLAILILMLNIKNKIIKSIPGLFVVLVVSIILSIAISLESKFKIKVPENILSDIANSINSGTFIKPDFSSLGSLVFFKFVLTFALVGSLESLLTSKAVDGLDPFKRKSNYNKELIAVGIGNTLTSLIGGLPMISEVARSSNNVNNGAKTRWSNFFHGLFLLLALVAAPLVINMIPKSALAAMLIFVGFRLASPQEFIKTYKIGPEQLVVFVVTILVTLSTDLLLGIFAGLVLEALIHVGMGASLNKLFKSGIEIEKSNSTQTIKMGENALFTNVLGFQSVVDSYPLDSKITVDFSNTGIVDHTFMETLHHYESDFESEGGQLNVINLEQHVPYSLHPMAARKIVNDAIFAPSKFEFNSRQSQLDEFSRKNEFTFEHHKTKSILKFRFSPFAITRQALFGENIILGSKSYANFFFADVLVKDTTSLANSTYFVTVLHLFEIKGVQIPDFSLEKEAFFDLIKNMQGYKDINFSEYPNFSKEYYLTGSDEEALRSFFTPELITFFEQNKGYYIEAKNNSIMLHKQIDTMSVEDMTSTLEFIDHFMKKVIK